MNAELICVEVTCENCKTSIVLPHEFDGVNIRTALVLAFCDYECEEEFSGATFVN